MKKKKQNDGPILLILAAGGGCCSWPVVSVCRLRARVSGFRACERENSACCLSCIMSAVRVAPASRAFANGNLVFGVVASGVADRDLVLLSSKSIGDFRLLSKDRQVTYQSHYGLRLLVTVFKGSGGSGALDSVYSVTCSKHKSCRSGHFARCFLQRAPGLVHT